MSIRDWALIVFTILAQTSVGALWVLLVTRYFAGRKYEMEEVDRLTDRALMAIGPVIVLGGVASLFHLSRPFSAYLAVVNIGTSWLSRESFFGAAFAALVIVFAILQTRKIGTISLRNVIAGLTALVGLGLIVSMSSVYMLPTYPAWDSWVTPVTFFTSTLLMGTLAVGAALVANYVYMQRKEPDYADAQSMLLRGTLRRIALAAVLLLGVEFVVLPIYLALLAAGPRAALLSAQLMAAGPFSWALVLRVTLAFFGAVFVSMFMYQNTINPGQEKMLGKLTYVAFVLVLLAEVLGRFLFYMTKHPLT